MGEFKRYDGYVMHIPQEFIDSRLPICPFCGTNNPHWLLDSKMEFSLAGNRTFYRCEQCEATMSSTGFDAAAEKGKGFAINPGAAALNAASKGAKHQEVGVTYMRVDSLGKCCTEQELVGNEYPITFFQERIKGGISIESVNIPSAAGTVAEENTKIDSNTTEAGEKPVNNQQNNLGSPTGTGNSNLDQLYQLKDLLDKGIITQEEFEVQKKRVMTAPINKPIVQNVPEHKEDSRPGGGSAVVGFIFGIIALFFWCVSVALAVERIYEGGLVIGLLFLGMGVFGLILSIKGIRSSKKGMAITGLIFNAVFLLLNFTTLIVLLESVM